MNTESQKPGYRLKRMIKSLNTLSEMGAFDDIDYETAKGIEDYLMAFINPTIDYDQAAKIFDKKADTIRTEVSRKLSPRKKIKHSSVRFRYLDLKNIIKK